MPSTAKQSIILLDRHWHTGDIFELRCSRPPDFTFRPGQFVHVACQGTQREYTLISAPEEPELRLLIKQIPQGRLSVLLATMPMGTELGVSAAQGYFCFQPSKREPCFIATGTGIAPFIAMCASGVRDFTLLHGVRHPSALIYRRELSRAAKHYIPCLSSPGSLADENQVFHGYVSTYVDTLLPPGDYDFYLCGLRNMIRDLTHLLDARYPHSHIYSEAYD